MEVGEYVKVWLPGETPWAEVLEFNGEIFKGRIDNKLFREYSLEEKREWLGENFETAEALPELHTHKQGDELWFQKQDGVWQPVSVQ